MGMQELAQPRGEEAHVDSALFGVYVRANATIPQVADGIKWIVHHAYASDPQMPLAQLAQATFSPQQVDVLLAKTTAIHGANNVSYDLKPPHFRYLMDRVTHSLVNNLHAYQSFIEGSPLEDYKSDSKRDAQVLADPEQIETFLHSPDGQHYQGVLAHINRTLDASRVLLASYRNEFKQGKVGSTVWRDEGYGAEFARRVQGSLDHHDARTSYVLAINNLAY